MVTLTLLGIAINYFLLWLGLGIELVLQNRDKEKGLEACLFPSTRRMCLQCFTLRASQGKDCKTEVAASDL